MVPLIQFLSQKFQRTVCIKIEKVVLKKVYIIQLK